MRDPIEDDPTTLLGEDILSLAQIALGGTRNPYCAALALGGALDICIRIEKDSNPQCTYSREDIGTMVFTATEAFAREAYLMLLENGEMAAILGKKVKK